MPKKVQKKTAAPISETKNDPKKKKSAITREEVLKDEDDEEKVPGVKLPSDDEVSPDALEAALDTEDAYEADMDEESEWE